MIDGTQLHSLFDMLGKDIINAIRLEFIEDSAEKMTRLQKMWADKNYHELEEVSHSLKSASLNMALQGFAARCQQIESAAAQHNDTVIQANLDGLSTLYQDSLKALEVYFLTD